MTMDKILTVIIVNWNTRQMLMDCLASLIHTTLRDDIDIIVVDNHSSDGSPKMVKSHFPQVRLIESPVNIGFAKANNLAIPHVGTPYIMFLNPDTVVLPDSISKMLAHIARHPRIALLGCRMSNSDGKLQELGIQWTPSPAREFVRAFLVSEKSIVFLKWVLPFHDPERSGYVSKLYGGCILARREVLEAVGWFDERFFMYAEDVDLSLQITMRGWWLYYLSEAEIIHVGGGASKKAGSQFSILMRAESTEKLLAKYYGPRVKFFYRLGMLTAALIRWMLVWYLRAVLRHTTRAGCHRFRASEQKYRALVLWSLNLKKAVIQE